MAGPTLRTLIVSYFALFGLSIHLFGLGLLLYKPDIIRKVYYLGLEKVESSAPTVAAVFKEAPKSYSLTDEINQNFGSWQPLSIFSGTKTGISINGRNYPTLKAATASLSDGDTLYIGEGIYREPLEIKRNYITVIGAGHVVIEDTAAQGKAAIITSGNHIHLKNIECRRIAVKDKNGSCVRHEGKHLKLTHVYFHDSEQGLLTGGSPGTVEILESRFERLGKNGRAHGIYVGGGNLILKDSLFIAARSQGHEIKSRAATNLIENCIVASLSSNDSRLIDISNGGVLTISNSILQQGPKSVNQDLIGYGLEQRSFNTNRVELKNNVIIMERDGPNVLFHGHDDLPAPTAHNNLIVGKPKPTMGDSNLTFETRSASGLEEYPALRILKTSPNYSRVNSL